MARTKNDRWHKHTSAEGKTPEDRKDAARLANYLLKHESKILTNPLWREYQNTITENGDIVKDRWEWKLKVAKQVVEGNGKK